jgi:hypothetical protein
VRQHLDEPFGLDGLGQQLHAGVLGLVGQAYRSLTGQQEGGQVVTALVAQLADGLQAMDRQPEAVVPEQG